MALMAALNFKHLRYFWMVAKSGTIARACEQLHLTPQAISGQLRELEEALGVELFRRAGRGLELTDVGRRILSYAEEIFALGDELLDVARDQTSRKSLPFVVAHRRFGSQIGRPSSRRTGAATAGSGSAGLS
jgi:LysR family transcriptional activator of nhaA